MIISNNQTVFMKGRSIIKNMLLAQEIIKDINRRNKLHNVVAKLDLEKTYNRISWIFLINMTRRFGFLERIIAKVVRLVSSNWSTILMNGQTFDFFSHQEDSR